MRQALLLQAASWRNLSRASVCMGETANGAQSRGGDDDEVMGGRCW